VLINTIESIALPYTLSVETGVLWVPTRWLDLAFRRSGSRTQNRIDLSRGDVFRISHQLFTHLWSVMDERAQLGDRPINEELFGGDTASPLLRYSPKETDAFAAWTEQHLLRLQAGFGFTSPP
jgi:hypothetical protein